MRSFKLLFIAVVLVSVLSQNIVAGERHVVDERNVRQFDPRFGRGAPVAVDRDVADGLERFVSQRVMLTGDQPACQTAAMTFQNKVLEVAANPINY